MLLDEHEATVSLMDPMIDRPCLFQRLSRVAYRVLPTPKRLKTVKIGRR